MRLQPFAARLALLLTMAPLTVLAAPPCRAGDLLSILLSRQASETPPFDEAGRQDPAHISVPGVTLLRDVAYGSDPLQRFDVYRPAHAKQAPVIVMVHGGGWRIGDKGLASVVDNKADYWLAKGFIFISVNNRLLPEADPIRQAEDVALAVATAQKRAEEWGGNAANFVLMGHSAGAHLVALLAADPERVYAVGGRPWRGTVMLDSAALNVQDIMSHPHFPLYDKAFGDDPAYWRSVSPFYQVSDEATPMLLVCSTRRQDSCEQSELFAGKVQRQGGHATVQPEDLSHREINVTLGLPGAYTDAVDAFIEGSLGS